MNLLKDFRHKDFKINSVDLCDVINKFREIEGNKTKKRHDNLLRDIDKEIEALKNVGISTSLNFEECYRNAKDGSRRYRYYEMNKKGAFQMLNKESAYVRYQTQEYIEELENENRRLSLAKERSVSRVTHNILHELIGDNRKAIGLDKAIYQIASYKLNLDYIYKKESMYRQNREHIGLYDEILSKAYDLVEMFKRRSKDGHYMSDVIDELKYTFVDNNDEFLFYIKTHDTNDDFYIPIGFGR